MVGRQQAIRDAIASFKKFKFSVDRFIKTLYHQKHAFYFRKVKQWSTCLWVSSKCSGLFSSLISSSRRMDCVNLYVSSNVSSMYQFKIFNQLYSRFHTSRTAGWMFGTYIPWSTVWLRVDDDWCQWHTAGSECDGREISKRRCQQCSWRAKDVREGM